MSFTPEQMVSMTLTYMGDLNKAQAELEEALIAEAQARVTRTRARAKAWQEVEGPNREHREALVDARTVTETYELDMAVGRAKAAMEQVRNKRQQLSAVQSASNSVREEAALARVGVDLHDDDQHGERPDSKQVATEGYAPPRAGRF